MKTKKRRVRLYSKREPRLPLPSYKKKGDKGFALRALETADGRFAVVKELHRRMKQLMKDAGVETLQREWIAARAVFLVARLESLEYDAVTGKQIDWREYLAATRALTDVLNKLGLDKEATTTKRLTDYIEAKRSKDGKHHRHHHGD